MSSDMLDRLRAVKTKADDKANDRENYAAYVADRIDTGWSSADVDEYRSEVGRIMASGTAEEKEAACEFWRLKAAERRGRAVKFMEAA